ncbi:MAG: hypothetical protein QOJ64_767 [Acidobacteriota bacterium]|jgi:hypothetical protein|nr:hypothetical protein [Acidobacteriota bacterium]
MPAGGLGGSLAKDALLGSTHVRSFPSAFTFEILDCALVLFGGGPRIERTKIFSFPGLGVHFA